MTILNMQLITRTHSSTTTTASPRARRFAQRSTLVACTVAALAAPGVASAADTVVAPDPAADRVTALDGTVVWVSGTYGDQVLMQRTPAGVIARVKGAPRAAVYGSIDLGHDSKGRLVLTYMRCGENTCTAKRDNLDGKRASFRRLTLKRCHLSTAPAMWGNRLAYGLSCRKPKNRTGDKRSGLYVKTGTGSPKRLRLPSHAVKLGITAISAVDLRRTRVAALAADVYDYAFTQTVSGTRLRSILVSDAEGDNEGHATGVSLGSGGVMWTLENLRRYDRPKEAIIIKMASGCLGLERLVSPPANHYGPEPNYRATGFAVDRSTLYLVVPGTGIVEHRFAPDGPCG